MAVRNINNSDGKKVIGKFPSNKMNRTIMWESTLERDFIYLLEYDRDVLRYKEQPLKIKGYDGDVIYQYTPDFLVVRKNAVELVEVKPRKFVDASHTKIQVRLGSSYCNNKGLNFMLVTDKDIREGHLLENIKILFRYSRVKVSLYHIHKTINTYIKLGNVTIEKLVREINFSNCEDNVLTIVYHLIYKQHLKVDLSKPLTKNSLIIGGDW